MTSLKEILKALKKEKDKSIDKPKIRTEEYLLGSEGPTREVPGLQARTWQDEIIYNGIANRVFSQLVMHNEDLVKSPGNSLVVPVVVDTLELRNTPPSQIGTTAARRTLTRMDEVLVDRTITIEPSDWYAPCIAVTFQDVANSRVDKLKAAKFFLQEQVTDIPDRAIASAFLHTSVTQRVYGRTATVIPTRTGEIVNGCIMTPDLFADAMERIERSMYVPFACLMHPAQANALRKDSQFTNASEYGSREVILKGEIGSYLGVKIVVSTNCPSYAATSPDPNEPAPTPDLTPPQRWNVAGATAIMIGKNRVGQLCAGGIFWKMKPTIEYQRNPEELLHKFMLTMAFKATVLLPRSVCLIKTSLV